MDAFASQAITHGLSGPAVVRFAIAAIIVGLIAYVCFMKGPGLVDIPFTTPIPRPAEAFALDATNPKLYRPFRHGVYHVTMGIRRLHWDSWIEMDSNFLSYHDLKGSELNRDLHGHVKYVDNATTKAACFEVYEELAQFLKHRYPTVFKLKDNQLFNTATGEIFRYPASTPTEALATAGKLVQDDLILMVENDDGQYHLDAACVCLPGFWRLKEKFRMSLDTLHIEAGVPHYEAKLQKAMNKFFKSMAPETPVTRNNYFIQLDDGLHWSHRMGEQTGDAVASWATANGDNLTINDLHFRSERQTLRRLPRSKVLLFTVRTYFEPVTVIAQEPHVPGRLAESIRSWDETVSRYKGRDKWEHILLPYLDEQHKRQAENGLLDQCEEGEFPF
ncbi:heme-dependent oxidative N-demethylase family protein [Aspergillus puulaauensis]|uniref:Uncharacterized protein n=1 Tax=Aspergillus puulaauensis TaxID=1220207 RepID=A0A7R7X9M4_9EURO|nr:uncharacterized protein APUU_10018S [Aspergillus puulaauensis]BCS17190.1 hypothetical protein APUU_10018S [Aspergillus puulaauensis]